MAIGIQRDLSGNKPISLKKGQKINLSKDGVNLKKIMLGL